MTNEQKAHIKLCWKALHPFSTQIVDDFYSKLFELDPSLRIVFKNDLGEQKRKLMQSLGFVVANMNSPMTLLPVIRHFGRRHALYGAQPTLFASAKQAFLYALSKHLGEAFTAEAQSAWNALLEMLITPMLAGAHDAAPGTRVAA